jgi:hypothetical protein
MTIDYAPIMETVARILLGDPNPTLSKPPRELRFGSNGSLRIDLTKGTFFDFEANEGGGVLMLIRREEGLPSDQDAAKWLVERGLIKGENPEKARIVATYDYVDEDARLLFQVVRLEPKSFRQRKPGLNGEEWIWKLGDTRRVPYRLPELREAIASDRIIFIVEGEKDADRMAKLGLVATCNPGGAGKWQDELTPHFEGACVIILRDNDEAGRKHGVLVADRLKSTAAEISILDLPDLPEKGDVSDWLDAGHTVEELWELVSTKTLDPDEIKPKPSPSTGAPLLDPWEDYVVPPFPLDVLPGGVREFVEKHARIIGCDVSGLAMATLVNFSVAIDNRIMLKMMRNGKWFARPRLWVILCGEVSANKTQTIDMAVDELEAIQGGLRREYEIALKAFQEDKDNTVDEPDKPTRFVTMSTTIEKLANILSRQQRTGFLIKSDELAGFIGSMEKYSSSSKGASANRAFWLKAYDGGAFFEDRVIRGENFISDLVVSMIGGIQPDRLAELHGLTSDGLLQRFLPVMVNPGELPKDEPTDSALGYYADLTRRLTKLQPQTITMNDDAIAEMERIRQRIRDIQGVASSVAVGFDGFVGKLRGIAGTLTLILHIIAGPDTAPRDVERETVRSASRIIFDFVLKHAFAFYRTAESMADGDRTQRLASYVLTSGKDRFVPSDLTTNVRHLRGLALPEVNKQVSVLVAGGWLTPEPKRDEQHEKRPMISNPSIPHAWILNPQVRSVMLDRAKTEDRRKAELAALWKTWATDDEPGP